jgi:hypothetical protein
MIGGILMQWLHYLLVLACPLMMIFMMRGMHRGNNQKNGQHNHNENDGNLKADMENLNQNNERLEKEIISKEELLYGSHID